MSNDHKQLNGLSSLPKKYFIGGLSVNCTQDELTNYLQQYGNVIECEIICDKQGKSKGYAFAAFSEQNQREDLVSKNHILLGKLFEIRELVDGNTNSEIIKEISKRKIFLSNLKSSLGEEVLSEFFGQFGIVEEVLISRDPHSQLSKGFGFVIFKEEGDAAEVLRHRSLKVKGWDVIVKPCLTKQEIQKTRKVLENRPLASIPLLPNGIDMSLVNQGFYQFYGPYNQFFPGGFTPVQAWVYPTVFGLTSVAQSENQITLTNPEEAPGLKQLEATTKDLGHLRDYSEADPSESQLPRLDGDNSPKIWHQGALSPVLKNTREESTEQDCDDYSELNRLNDTGKGFVDCQAFDMQSTTDERPESSDEATRDCSDYGKQSIFEYFRRQKRFNSYCDMSPTSASRSSTGFLDCSPNKGSFEASIDEKSPQDGISLLKTSGYRWFEPLTVSKEKFDRLNRKMRTGLRTLSISTNDSTEELMRPCLPGLSDHIPI